MYLVWGGVCVTGAWRLGVAADEEEGGPFSRRRRCSRDHFAVEVGW